MDKLSPLLFDAIAMYKANETTKRGFTKDSIKSILLTVFGIAPPNSGKLSSKSEWLKLLQQQDKDHPGKIDSPVAANATADLGTAATQSNVNIHWLYTMPTSKGEYDDRCFAVGNIFGGSPSEHSVKLKLISLRVRMKMMILIVQVTMQTIYLMHSKTAVYSREEMWISFTNWLKIQLD